MDGTPPEAAKRLVRDLVDTVWMHGRLDALGEFYSEGCRNHAAAPHAADGLPAMRAYHEQMLEALGAFSEMRIDVVQQVAEGDRVVTHLRAAGRHAGSFAGVPASGRSVELATIRIDRLEAGRIAEHWSIADLAGLMQQLQA